MTAITADNEQLARQAIALMELFALNHDDTERRIVGICERALTPFGPVAAVCVYPRFVLRARTTLDRLQAPRVNVIAVVNFPNGGTGIEAAVSETSMAMMAGADEIDVVYPFSALICGDQHVGGELISACKSVLDRDVKLTVTLETGELRDSQIIHDACRSAIEAGADFLKTSTGKAARHASPQAARIMLESIGDVGGQVGFKAAGGLRTFEEARVFIQLAQARFGSHWISRERVRMGGSSLLDDLLMQLGVNGMLDRQAIIQGKKRPGKEPGQKP
ncbi:deoxyribose-phosphate aldolase [Pseudomonas viridiflava]|uniref:deoxyribose-phosphate aldolase n=1 Tax=Pseudomonas viridiflava TaxID=33069 RepID=UPI0015E37CC9|nr:deoxyribose-phosphate aldolase [Pseudomonas viridiflava]MBA1232840.1 deoxyribose-phosphate aldolase [Pseudomonas viridiflava]